MVLQAGAGITFSSSWRIHTDVTSSSSLLPQPIHQEENHTNPKLHAAGSFPMWDVDKKKKQQGRDQIWKAASKEKEKCW